MDFRIRTSNVSVTLRESAGRENLIRQVKDAMGNRSALHIAATSQAGVAPVAVTLSGAQVDDAVIDGVPIMNGGTPTTATLRVDGHGYPLKFKTAELFKQAKEKVEAPAANSVPVREVRFILSTDPGREVVLLIRSGRNATLDTP
jgi:hypothetical protein